MSAEFISGQLKVIPLFRYSVFRVLQRPVKKCSTIQRAMPYSKCLQGRLLVKNFIHLPMHTPHRSKLVSRVRLHRSHSSIIACRLPVWDTLCCELTCRVSQRELIFLFADTNVPSSKEILTTRRLGHLTELAVHMQKV